MCVAFLWPFFFLHVDFWSQSEYSNRCTMHRSMPLFFSPASIACTLFSYHEQIAVCMRTVKYRLISQFIAAIAHALHTLLALFPHFYFLVFWPDANHNISHCIASISLGVCFFFGLLSLPLLYLLFVCSSKFHWICLTKENSANTPNDANKRLISRCLLLHLVRCFFYSELAGFFFSSKYTIRWPFALPHNQYVL